MRFIKGITQNGISFCPVKAMLTCALCTLAFVLHTSEGSAPIAREFVEADMLQGKQDTKTDRWSAPQSRTLQAIRLAHLWDGTPDDMLNAMVAPVDTGKPLKILVAYAPSGIRSAASDAMNTLQRFNMPEKLVAAAPQPAAPRPAPRPNGLRPSLDAPLALLGDVQAQTAFNKDAVAAQSAPPEVKLASLAPVAVPVPHETREVLSTLNLPYTLQTPYVQATCFPEKLVGLIKVVEAHYNRKVIITSGQRDHGRKGSLHRHCAAADIIVPGVSGAALAAYVRTIPNVGGVGQYCHPYLVHMDVGSRRDWDWNSSCMRKNVTVAKAATETAPKTDTTASIKP